MLTGMRAYTGGTAGMHRNKNVMHTRHVLEALGATAIEVESTSKHLTVWFTTKEGARYWCRVSLAPRDPRKIKAWARQAYTRAAGRVGHEQSINDRR